MCADVAQLQSHCSKSPSYLLSLNKLMSCLSFQTNTRPRVSQAMGCLFKTSLQFPPDYVYWLIWKSISHSCCGYPNTVKERCAKTALREHIKVFARVCHGYFTTHWLLPLATHLQIVCQKKKNCLNTLLRLLEGLPKSFFFNVHVAYSQITYCM